MFIFDIRRYNGRLPASAAVSYPVYGLGLTPGYQPKTLGAHPTADVGRHGAEEHAQGRQRHGEVESIRRHQVLVQNDEAGGDAHPDAAREHGQHPSPCHAPIQGFPGLPVFRV